MTNTERPLLTLALFRPNLDVTFKGWQGGAIYIQNLVHILSELDEAIRPRIIVLTDGMVDTPIVRALFAETAVEGVFQPDGAPLTLKPPLFQELIESNGTPRRAEIDKLLASSTAIFPIFRTMLNVPKGLHWIPDFQHKHLPDMFDAAELARREEDFTAMAYGRRFLLLSSNSARDDLHTFYPGVKAETFVWPFTSALNASEVSPHDPREQYKLPEKYLFAPNQFWKHKDHRTLFEAVRILHERGLDVTLACTGSSVDFRHPGHFDALRAYVNDSGLAEKILFLGTVPTDTLLQLIRFSTAVVQPSLFEGWSTVVEDAKVLARPIFLTDLPVHHEQAVPTNPFFFFKRGNAGHLADMIAAQWPLLKAGPDAAAEQRADAARRERSRRSALAFVEILRRMAGAHLA